MGQRKVISFCAPISTVPNYQYFNSLHMNLLTPLDRNTNHSLHALFFLSPPIQRQYFLSHLIYNTVIPRYYSLSSTLTDHFLTNDFHIFKVHMTKKSCCIRWAGPTHLILPRLHSPKETATPRPPSIPSLLSFHQHLRSSELPPAAVNSHGSSVKKWQHLLSFT